ncbi:hypothetical protein FGB62_5g127 [Gracilaria domingensis]|nr:hypothetical protein FGB62_5g127 [Gracilaria domingensis]
MQRGCDFDPVLTVLTWIPTTVSLTHRHQRSHQYQAWSTQCTRAVYYGARQCSRRSVLLSVAASVLSLSLNEAGAVCGEPDPFFAHFLDWREDFASFEGRQIHYRLIGSKKKEKKAKKYPVVYLGDAGVSMASGETLELLGGTDRRVLLVDQLGVGESQSLEGQQKRQWPDMAADELSSVLLQSGIANEKTATKIHLVAVGFGIQVADVLLKRFDADSTGYQVASVVTEGWSLPQSTKNMSFSAMQGERICAAEGAEGGNIDLLRTIYGGTKWNPKAAMKDISALVPVMALQMKEWPSIDLQGTSIREKELDGDGRIPHLAAPDRTLGEMERFFDEVEGRVAEG